MRLASSRSREDRLRAILRYGLFALLAAAPLPFGSVEPWAVAVLEVAAALLGAGAIFALYRNPSLLSARARWLLVPAGVLLVLGVLQLLPARTPGSKLLPAPTADARRALAGLFPEVDFANGSSTLEASETTDAILRLAAYVCIGLAATVAVQSPSELRSTALCITLLATFQAFYGVAEYLSGHQHIFGYAKKYYVEEATGTFINRNHFAAYLAMSLPFAVSLVLATSPGRFLRSSWRETVVGLLRGTQLRRFLAVCGAGMIWTGVLLSFSRAALATSAMSVVVATSASPKRRRATWIVVGVLVLPLAILLWRDARAPGERLSELGSDIRSSGGRLAVWTTTLHAIPDYALLGSGYGTFEEVFATLQPAGIDRHYDHAHNDWLQVLLEGGVLALASCVALLILALYPTSAESLGRSSVALLERASVAGIAAIALHSLVDFSLRIPSIAVLAAVLVGLSASRGATTQASSAERASTVRTFPPGGRK